MRVKGIQRAKQSKSECREERERERVRLESETDHRDLRFSVGVTPKLPYFFRQKPKVLAKLHISPSLFWLFHHFDGHWIFDNGDSRFLTLFCFCLYLKLLLHEMPLLKVIPPLSSSSFAFIPLSLRSPSNASKDSPLNPPLRSLSLSPSHSRSLCFWV